ncbi:MAG: 30S ribosomal protein S2 [Oligoflexia bacterium]|nr:30S ribosomal protein S2 [Oligoflexia bacterium]
MQEISIQSLIEVGAHFGHELKKWNPKMKDFVYKERGGIHIIDLQKTLICAKKAMSFLEKKTAEGGHVVFVGTKIQAVSAVQAAAESSKQFYVTKRWLGGTLTNFETLKESIDRMKKIQKIKERFELDRYSKKERNQIEKEYSKMEESFRGIKDMKDLPSALFIVDLKKERIALNEARKLRIPVSALVDTNCDPNLVEYPIPANDDSLRCIQFFLQMAGEACQKGWDRWERSLSKEQYKKDKKFKSSSATAGPQVVSLNKGRQLVAAGMAEDVEMEIELKEESTKDSDKQKG